MKNVVAILATKRRCNTYNLLVQIKDILNSHEINLEIIELYRYDIKYCSGCYNCVNQEECIIDDDINTIMNKISNADGIILASPVYLQQVSGKLKTFIDRTCKWYHRPVLTAKPILCVATTNGSGLKSTLKYMQNVAIQWGAIVVPSVGRTIFNKSTIEEKEIAKFIKLLEYPEDYSPKLIHLIDFEVRKTLSKIINERDLNYWTAKGWMNKSYYYNCKINVIKSIISSLVGRIIRNRIEKQPVNENQVR